MHETDDSYRLVGEKVAGTTAAKASKSQLDEALLNPDRIDKSQPITPVNVETHPTRIIERPDGTRHHDWVLMFRRSDVEAMRQGYACLRCWSWQDGPFPERCRNDYCGYEMRDFQAEDFAREFDGVKWVGSRLDLDEERERLKDWVAEDKLKEHERIPGLLVPGWAKT